MDILGKGGTLDLSSLASQAMTIRYSAVVNLAIWLYEFSMTADKEVRLVWPSRFTIVKVLFFANRYLPLFTISANAYFLILNDNDDEYLCKPALLFVGYMSFAGFFLAEVVLAFRVYVVWQARKSILILVFGTLFAKTGISGAITYFYLTSTEMSPINLFRSGCEGIFTRRIEWITMLLVFIFEIEILSLMIIAKRVHFKRSRSELVDILLKDGVLYCITIMAISLMNIFAVKFAPPIISPFLVVTQGLLHNILCTRLLLRLRTADARRTSVIVSADLHIPMKSTASTSRASSSQ